ncbi:hypothetical protein QBC46DRAFT_449796 [Diplogelasinospora grovesii]|uniref:Caspase domain-containing protein n=1 Tax=Diplogelasinospora grovesii TaxID=303347 RepID=A0AAN6S4I1_9PEZI|nr:hypothetical protein QBC46DRAFT_449796 [Diplogelasinospora grovesii]
MSGDIKHLVWHCHLLPAGDDFSTGTGSMQAQTSRDPSRDRSFDERSRSYDDPVQTPRRDPWDEGIESVVDALQELTIHSPITTATPSPETAWFTHHERDESSSIPRTKNQRWSAIEPGAYRGKGKGLAINNHFELSRDENNNDVLFGDEGSYTLSSESTYTPSHNFERRQKSPPDEVYVLILTWAKHDTQKRGEDGQLLSPGLDSETNTVRSCFKQRGYRVQCRLIPEDYPTATIETILDKFLRHSNPSSLLIMYYHGFGSMEDGRMAFSSDGGDGSKVFWDDIRDPIMSAPGDVLLIVDCCCIRPEPLELILDPGMIPAPDGSVKQLLLGVAPENGTGAAMTKSLCRVLDDNPPQQNTITDDMTAWDLYSLMTHDMQDNLDNFAAVSESSRLFATQLVPDQSNIGHGQVEDIIFLPRFNRVTNTPAAVKRQSVG